MVFQADNTINTSSGAPTTRFLSPTEFPTYDEYLSYVDQRAASEYQNTRGPDARVYEEDVWLAHFDDKGNCIQWYRYWADAVPDNSQPPLGSAEPSNFHKTVTSPEKFEAHLDLRNKNVAFQVIIIALESNAAPSKVTAAILGRGLGMRPEILDQMKKSGAASEKERKRRPIAWTKSCPVLLIGDHSLVTLSTEHGGQLNTAVISLATNRYHWESLSPNDWINKNESPLYTRRKTPADEVLPGLLESYDVWHIRKYITAESSHSNLYGHVNAASVSLSTLVELHLSRTWRIIPAFTNVGDTLPFESNHNLDDDSVLANKTVHPDGTVQYDARWIWSQMRTNVDEQRKTLMWLPRFVQHNFRVDRDHYRRAPEDLLERFELHAQELELKEARLRDHIEIHSSRKSTEMAELSIRESKRVMLLTALAFTFLPISLASSIYGMNVQQINGTGHSIASFIMTAFVMVAIAVCIWAGIAGFISLRSRRIKEWDEKNPHERTLRDELLVHGVFAAFSTWDHRRRFRQRRYTLGRAGP